MALIFGSGEPVSRLRRSFDVKGKVNLGVDEIIVPTVLLQDGTLPPFRRTGVRWWFATFIPAVVGEFARLRIAHPLPVDPLVEAIEISSVSDGIISVGQGPAGAVGGVAGATTEVVDANNGGVISRLLPILFLADSVTPTSLNRTFWQIGELAGVPGHFRLPIVLPAMANPEGPATNAPTLTLEHQSSNVGFFVSVSGLYWDSLPLNVRT